MKHAASPPPRRQRLGQLPYWLLLLGTGAGLLAMRRAGPDIRGGTLVLAGVLLASAVARLALPDRRAGLLKSRRRLPDAAAFAVLGFGLLAVGLLAPAPV